MMKLTLCHFFRELVFLLCLWSSASAFCPNNCTCDDRKLTVNCITAGLDVIPITLNPNLRELRLSRNRIKYIISAFTVYQQLDYLDVSYNQITELGKNSFNIPNLRKLILDHNSIQKLLPGAFKGLQGLKILRMKRNFLKEIPSHIFRDTKSLEELDLSENRISNVQPDAFAGLRGLTSLLLRDNKLKAVPTSSFFHLTHLSHLDLGRNNFRIILEKSFLNLQRLKNLILDHCSITILESQAFANLDSLTFLNLEVNDLDDISADALSGLTHLEELYIGQNQFKTLSEDAFSPLSNLKVLSIVKAQSLESIDERAFASCPSMEQIILKNNRLLAHLDVGTFASLRHLQSVSLKGNGFESFHPDLLHWTQLKSFDLRDNPLVCNCSVTWLWDLLRTLDPLDQIGNWTNVRCKNPAYLHNELLKSLSHYDLDCDGNKRRNVLIVGLCISSVLVIIVLGLLIWYKYKVSFVLKKKLNSGKYCEPYPGHFKKSESVVAFYPQHDKYRLTPVAYM